MCNVFNVTLTHMEFKCARLLKVTFKTRSLNVQCCFNVSLKDMQFKCARFFNVTLKIM